MNEYALTMAAGNQPVTVHADTLTEAIEIAEAEHPGIHGVLMGRQVLSRPGEPRYDQAIPMNLRSGN
ncbi:hypothetical protein [Curtobacterium flaccumfaciens]|uniref:hypothetical protein n=1 Tax=Curtobacterium flaccumfaciens TaxID=2035 RepID=UPI002657EE33|nr:hypothetical protein [Curtobacterium flaccumfaciens]MCS0491179.1 hypothetical protein [Curtobacterium flaccumfaciens pv. betae]